MKLLWTLWNAALKTLHYWTFHCCVSGLLLNPLFHSLQSERSQHLLYLRLTLNASHSQLAEDLFQNPVCILKQLVQLGGGCNFQNVPFTPKVCLPEYAPIHNVFKEENLGGFHYSLAILTLVQKLRMKGQTPDVSDQLHLEKGRCSVCPKLHSLKKKKKFPQGFFGS